MDTPSYKIIDWTIGALKCRDLHEEYHEQACKHCPLFENHSKYGKLETITFKNSSMADKNIISCNMFDNVVQPLQQSTVLVQEKDQKAYDYYKMTGLYKYF